MYPISVASKPADRNMALLPRRSRQLMEVWFCRCGQLLHTLAFGFGSRFWGLLVLLQRLPFYLFVHIGMILCKLFGLRCFPRRGPYCFAWERWAKAGNPQAAPRILKCR